MDAAERDQLVVQYLPLVGYLVSDLCARATQLDRDELASAGQFALFQASRSFDPSRGVPFGSYARTRINGALYDDLRSKDWVSRKVRSRIKAVKSVMESLTASLGRTPTIDEVAAVIGYSREDVSSLLNDAGAAPIALQDRDADLAAHVVDPEESAQQKERDAFLRRAVAALPERHRIVVSRIYFEEQQVRDIAKDLGVTPSAVSFTRGEAMRMLQEAWVRHYDPDIREPHHVSRGTQQYEFLLAVGASGAAGGQ